MALIKCPECGKEISSKAVACPSCGNPIASKRQAQPNTIWTTPSTSFGCLTVIGIIIILIMLIMIVSVGEGAEPEYPPPVTAPCVRVIDGDTIECVIEGKIESVRLIGVNTPERGEPGYEEARDFMIVMCEGEEVRLEFDHRERDRWGRILGYVFLKRRGGDTFVNGELLRSGNALFYGYFSTNRYNEVLLADFCE